MLQTKLLEVWIFLIASSSRAPRNQFWFLLRFCTKSSYSGSGGKNATYSQCNIKFYFFRSSKIAEPRVCLPMNFFCWNGQDFQRVCAIVLFASCWNGFRFFFNFTQWFSKFYDFFQSWNEKKVGSEMLLSKPEIQHPPPRHSPKHQTWKNVEKGRYEIWFYNFFVLTKILLEPHPSLVFGQKSETQNLINHRKIDWKIH